MKIQNESDFYKKNIEKFWIIYKTYSKTLNFLP
jgi:hypothetical protein